MKCTLVSLLVATSMASPIAVRETSTTKSGVWPSQTYVTENFTAPNMTIKRYGDTEPGYLFLSPSGNGTSSPAPVVISDTNELIWRGPAGGWTYNNVRIQEINDTNYLTYWKGNSSATFGHGYGSIKILNSSYVEEYSICPKNLGILAPNNTAYECYLDMHESYATNSGTVISSAYNVTRADLTSVGGPKDGWIFDSLFYEIDIATQEVLFRWRSLDHLAQIPLSESKYPLKFDNITFGASDILPWDYFHINSVQALSDGYLVNSRHLFSTYKVSKNGSIDWHLSGYNGGDFTLQDGVYFSWQHNPRVINTTCSGLQISYFNNDNSEVQNGTNSTTGLLLNVNTDNKTVTLDRKLVTSSELIFADSQGSYQALANGHALVGYGQIAKTREYNSTNHLVYEAQYGYSTEYSPVASYRSYRQNWTATPKAAPKVVAQYSSGTTKVYASWNGATDYDGWEILAGASAANLSIVAVVAKTGFETQHTLHGSYEVVQVLARDGGQTLANSSVITVGS